MRLRLRSATDADYLQIASWIPDADACERWAGPGVAFPFQPSELQRLLAGEDIVSCCLVAARGELLGFGQYLPRPRKVVHLMRIIVSPARRGEGIGRVLCEQLMARAVDATGASAVSLNVYADNEPALALYRSLGFRRDNGGRRGDSLSMKRPAPR